MAGNLARQPKSLGINWPDLRLYLPGYHFLDRGLHHFIDFSDVPLNTISSAAIPSISATSSSF